MSQMSNTGSAIIFDSTVLTINTKGMADKNAIPRARHFLVFSTRVKRAAIIQRKIIEITDIAVPIENTSLVFVK